MDDGDHAWVMAARPSPKHGHHHPLISRFHRTGGPHDPHSVRWSVPSELMGWVNLGLVVHTVVLGERFGLWGLDI